MNASRWSAACVLFAAAATFGCGKTATKDDCEKAFTHIIDLAVAGQDKSAAELVKKQMAKDERDGFLKECDGKATKAEIDCIVSAKTSDDIDKCK